MTEFLTLEDLLHVVRAADIGPVRDLGLLEAAVARPRSSAFGVDAYPELHQKAAALLHSLVANRALVDGNKRLGWLATTVFFDINGAPTELEDDAAFELVMDVAATDLDVQEITSRLRQHS